MDITLRSTLIVVTKTAETLGVSLPSGYIVELDRARAIPAPTDSAKLPPANSTPPSSTRSKPAATSTPTRSCSG